nr:valine N-monooxygenase 1-like [Tanacetum cinerariifolium]
MKKSDSDIQYAVSIKEDTVYLCLHFTKDHEGNKINTQCLENPIRHIQAMEIKYSGRYQTEAFRLHPVAPFNIPHISSVDTTVAGYFIPKGSHVLLSRPRLGRNPEVWDDPLTYNPDRHMKNDKEVVLTDHNLDMLSFSTGQRGCAGLLLGSTMTIMLLARLIQGFNWELPSNEVHVDLKENLQNLSKAKPLLALAKSRVPHQLYPET